jgi:hypothetical protein
VDKQPDLISRLQDEADLCRNDGADDIAALLDEAVAALRDRNHDTAVGEKWRTDSRLEEWFPVTAERLAALEAENAALKREAHTWSKAAENYAAELERHKPLLKAVEWILEDGHMNQEHLARLRAAWEGA